MTHEENRAWSRRSFTPTSAQRDAIEKIVDWYSAYGIFRTPDDYTFMLAGFAGTGKSSLIGPIIDELNLDASSIRIAAFTGKAAHVVATKLKRSGRDDLASAVSTIHRLIYRPDDTAVQLLRNQEMRIEDLVEASELQSGGLNDAQTAELRRLRSELPSLRRDARKTRWIRRPRYELAATTQLIVLDEASMISERMAEDLLSFRIPILAIGDPAQLPPVNGNPYFTDSSADVTLTEVHRQALESPAIRIATALRSGSPIAGMDGDSGRVAGWSKSSLLEFEQVLCGTNKRRWALIGAVRSALGLTSPLPVPGDKIIILQNDYDIGVFNGQMFTVYHVEPDDGSDLITAIVTDGSDEHLDVRRFAFDKRGFGGLDAEKVMLDEIRMRRWNPKGGKSENGYEPAGVVAATFGWAITTHKAQGSQFDSVLVIDEAWLFGKYAMSSGRDPEATIRSWRYTAATRAERRVVLAGRP